MSKILFLRLLSVIFVGVLLMLTRVQAEPVVEVGVDEKRLKAAYLINIIKYTTWPVEKMQSQANFNICIAEESSLKESLDEIKGLNVKNKSLNILHPSSSESLTACHIIYVENANKALFLKNKRNLNSILSVSSDDDFLNEGGILQFQMQDNRIKMRVKIKILSSAKLIISSNLLRLMEIVF
jgi:hypothetical protein